MLISLNVTTPTRRNALHVGSLWAIASLAAICSGCSIFPGLNLSEKDVPARDRYHVVKSKEGNGYVVRLGGGDIEFAPEVVPVTPDLIRAERLEVEINRSAVRALSSVDPGVTMPEYRIGPGDVLAVTVWEHPELTNPTGTASTDPVGQGRLVAADGTVFYPYVGIVPCAGKTVMDVRKYIADRLATVITSPQVDVRVSAYRAKRVQVFGEVGQPGIVNLNDTPKGIIEAISERGGLAGTASRRRAYLQRDGKVYLIDLSQLLSGTRPGINVELQAGDVLQIPDKSADQVFMLGAVAGQRSVFLEQDRLSLIEALTTSGGLDKLSANDSGVLIFRRAKTLGMPPKIFALDMSNPQGLLLAGEFDLQARDVVYVKSTDFAKYNSIVNQILPTVTAVFELNQLTK